MLDWLTDYLIKKRLKRDHIHTDTTMSTQTLNYLQVLNTLRENKIMVKCENDGVYIRMAGNEYRDECFSLEWAKVKSF